MLAGQRTRTIARPRASYSCIRLPGIVRVWAAVVNRSEFAIWVDLIIQMGLKMDIVKRLQFDHYLIFDGIRKVFSYERWKLGLKGIWGSSLLEQDVCPAGIPVPGLWKIAAIKTPERGKRR